MSRANTAKVLAATLLGSVLLQIGIIVGLYSAVHAPANLLFGRLADRFGRKLPLNLGLAWDAASLALYAVASTPLQLALVRASHGIGGGLVGPSSMSLIADASVPERKGRAMALYGMSIALAVVLGFGVAGPLARVSYTLLFLVLA